MSKINSRSKGIRGELEVCKLFCRWFPDTHRNGEKQRAKNIHCPDLGGEIEKYFYVEVKRYKKLRNKLLMGFWNKMSWDSVINNNESTLVVAREDYQKDWIVLYSGLDPINEYMDRKIAGYMGQDDEVNSVWAISWQDFQNVMDKKFDIKITP